MRMSLANIFYSHLISQDKERDADFLDANANVNDNALMNENKERL